MTTSKGQNTSSTPLPFREKAQQCLDAHELIKQHPDYKEYPQSTSGSYLASMVHNQRGCLYALPSKPGEQPSEQPTVKSLAAFLATFYNPSRGCAWPSQETICDRMGLSRVTLRRLIPKLLQTGLWAMVPGSNDKSSHYYPLFIEGGNQAFLNIVRKMDASGSVDPEISETGHQRNSASNSGESLNGKSRHADDSPFLMDEPPFDPDYDYDKEPEYVH